MKAAWYERTGPAREVLRLGEMPVPEPGAGEVLVRLHASGVNPSDTKSRIGNGARANAWPRVVPHQDGAGVVEGVGPEVSEARIGQRVWLYEAQLGRAFGTAAEYVALPAGQAVPLPPGVSFEEGAALGVPAMTAHRCVFADGPVRGRTVLVTGGAGAVGYYAVQFAAQAGARVIATVGRDEHVELVQAAGAALVVNRRREDAVARVAGFCGDAEGRGLDHVVDVNFAANLPMLTGLLRRGGSIATYASDAGLEPSIPFRLLMNLNARLHFVLVYTMGDEAHRAAAAAITEGLEGGTLRHRLGARFPLERIAEAHEVVEAGGAPGKVIITLP
ncbi:NADPH:quinone reductase [Roseomonas marmotae]|uniref:NADPH:quinone reductase n=1 Tax=Roseomonas marmotae TaxID=2768161 RepID=A0ABS3KBQ3_9PROT|nr:NADPH:quinone reductase [Roseomonas marmotae]MBO1074908.1 NADPH:quinone reductase [Roseomonas marmotae]QTI80044.1 NADPH:quinone reductase [Roseomonas marmotae]